MNTLNKQSNLKAIRNFLDSYPSPPVKVIDIAEKLGLKVYQVPGWEKRFSGMIQKEPEGEYSIYVNEDHTKTRKRFTIAHEIAHYVLHKSLIGDGLVDDALYRSGLSNLLEAEANNFAADILMPMHLVREATSKEDSIVELAKIFNVSPQAMAIRLKVAQE